MERTRFSLLLLEPEEIYFEDFSASSFSDNDTEKNFQTQRQLGRLKLCSKSLVFDPQDINQPVIKIPIQSCVKIVQGKRPWIQGEDNVIELECESHAQMLEGNVIAAYKFKQEKTKFQFLLNYAKVSDCLPQILQLQRASTLPPPEQSSMIAAIVHSRQSRISFNTKWLENIYEEIIIQIQAKKVSPLVVNPGKIVLTNSRIYFQPYNNIESYPVLKIDLKNITRIILRRFLLKQVGIEIFFKARIASDNVDHFYFTFNSKEDRDEFYDLILKQAQLSLRSLGQEIMTLKWQNRAISNYEYLLYVNSLADRSFNDLTQYPVFPWILSDYSSKTLDLNDRHCYRDLSKPIGALNEERLQKLKERSEEMPDPKFLYGSHYSTPGFVIFYLVRKFPHYMLCLQNGRFDHPDRMFNSIADVWRNVNTNMSDFKELIPEFYDTSQSGDFLVNTYGINFGYRCDGNKIHDVHLPPWAESPADFVRKQHEALESDYVSENIHNWIDLIFGYKQQGGEAKKANNVFYHLCYEGAVDIDSVKDFSKKHALEVQIMEFGQIPKQIFKVPHPPRLPPFSPLSGSSSLLQPVLDYESGDSCSIDISNINKTRVADTNAVGITSITIARNNEFFICGCLNSSVRMYSLENEFSTRSFQMNKGVSLCVLLPDDNIVVSATVDDRIVVYDINYGKIIDSVVGHEDKITNICWGAKSRCLVSSSWDCSVKVWRNIFEGDKWHRLKVNSALRFDFDSRVTCCAINGDNELIGCGTEEGEVYVINITTNSYELKRTSAHESYVSAVSFSPVVGKLISCSFDGSFNVFDLLTGMLVYSHKWPLKLLCLAWNGLSLMMGTNAGYIYIWDLIKVKLTPFRCYGKNINCISLSNNGKFLVTGEDYMIVIRS